MGTGKTLTAAGSVSDGNSGNNYTVTFVPTPPRGSSPRAITVTAAANSKVYDGTTTAAATPTVTAGSLAAGDTAAFSESYDTQERGHGQDAHGGRLGQRRQRRQQLHGDVCGGHQRRDHAPIAYGLRHGREQGLRRRHGGHGDSSGQQVGRRHVTDNYATATFADKEVGAGKAVSVSALTYWRRRGQLYAFQHNGEHNRQYHGAAPSR